MIIKSYFIFVLVIFHEKKSQKCKMDMGFVESDKFNFREKNSQRYKIDFAIIESLLFFVRVNFRENSLKNYFYQK